MSLPEPTLARTRRRLTEFAGDRRFAVSERAVSLIFSQWPRNSDAGEVLAKVVVINRLYNTNIYDVYAVADRIVSLAIDARLRAGDLGLVDDIARVTVGGKPRVFLSFASKYCAWHEPDRFQIYDSYVDATLWAYQRQFGFADFRREQLREYPTFCAVVDRFRERFNLTSLSRRELDHFLWAEGATLTGP